MIYTAVCGTNADLVERVAAMYVKDDDIVADVTYGKGAFWSNTDMSRFKLLPTDIETTDVKMDFCRLKYGAGSIDHVVLDPPYMHNPGKPMVDGRYRNAATTGGLYHRDILRLYRRGMAEAGRVLKEGGLLWVKCKDEIESGIQRWSHIEIYEAAMFLGFYARDLFVFVPQNNTVIQNKKQQHARKNHSYLWIFELLSDKRRKQIGSIRC